MMHKSEKYFRPEVLAKISRLELRARRVVEGFVSGLHRSPHHGFSVEFAEHREYVPGDDVRHIDWRVYARADRFYVKQYEEETNFRAQIVLDCSGSMRYPEQPGPGRMSKWDYASTVAASLAYLLALQHDAPGLILFDHAVRYQAPPTSHRGLLRQTIDHIEQTRPDSGTEIKILLRHLVERLHSRGMVILISDLLTEAEDVAEGLRRLSFAGHDVIVMHVLDRDELEFPFTDHTLFEGLEDGDVELLVDPQSLRRSYIEAVESFVSNVRGTCADHNTDYVLLSTGDPLDVALTGFLARRMHLLKRR